MRSPIYTHRLELWTQNDEHEIIEKLDELRHITVELAVDKTHAVARARALGLTWDQIGRELNMTRQAAWERWRHVEPPTVH